MLTKIFSLALIVTLLCAPVAARGDSPLPVEEIKARVIKRGTGERARVNVKLMDGTKLKGYISEAGEESFVLTEPKTGQSTTLAYREVREVKGQGLSRAAKIGIGVGIGVGVGVTALALSLRNLELFPRQ